jgi:hypothetical protein
MQASWNFVFVFALGLLYGQSLGFWPFDVVAELHDRKSLYPDYPDTSARRIAIIGALYFAFHPFSARHLLHSLFF